MSGALKTVQVVKLRQEFFQAVADDLVEKLHYYEADDELDVGKLFARLATFYRIEGAMSMADLLEPDEQCERTLRDALEIFCASGQQALDQLRPLLHSADVRCGVVPHTGRSVPVAGVSHG